MNRKKAQSKKALAANELVEDLQQYFVSKLNILANAENDNSSFKAVEWLRDDGQHGGGIRYEAVNERVFNRASVNVSQVHYEELESKSLASATAISTIIHPQNPYAPSVHMHISWTEMKGGQGYWRLMADLNPAIAQEEATSTFIDCLKNVNSAIYELACAQGDRYFFIPALNKHRGVAHFYLEEYNSHNEQADFNLAKTLGMAVIDTYIMLFAQAIQQFPEPGSSDYDKQLAYHTMYLFQVLTLDRGTTSGLLIHDQNDLGIMGSLPAQIDKKLLSSFKNKLQFPQDQLLADILEVLPDDIPCLIDKKIKIKFANVIRQHYKANPDALAMQAHGNVIPDTVENHR